MKAEILRKLTLKNCGLTVAALKTAMEAAKIEDGQQIPVLKVVGKTTTAANGTTAIGTFTALGGEFTGINNLTGEIFTSGKCILPNFISESVASALAQSSAVEFALEIGVKRDDKSVTGYQFTTKPLIEAKPTDAMAALLAAAGIDANAPAKLSAPAPAPAEPEKAPDPAPEKQKPKK